ncbi:MAG: hypothetical protein AAGU77_07000 [Bacillota bacterium]
MQTQPIPEITPEDIQQNKTMAILAYFIFFLPLLAAKESKFARYHANQGLVLLLAFIAVAIVSSIITSIIVAAMTFSGLGALAIVGLLFTLVDIAIGVLGIIGIVNAAQGKVKPMPVLGSITIIK